MNKSNRPSSEFVVCYSTTDNIHANLHAYCRGDGTVRDNNHVVDIVREFCHGNEDKIITRAPIDGERVMFEIRLGISGTRHGTSDYFGLDYQQFQPCPHCVAEAGMDIYLQIKHLLCRAQKRMTTKGKTK